MATEANNLKLARVPAGSKSTLSATVLAAGSTVFDESEKRVVVGDGSTAGGVPMAKKSETVNHTAQTLTDAQKTQARTNIGAAADTAVVKVTAQTLTDAQKTQARTNTDSQSASELKTALEELITEFGGTVPTE